MFNRLTIVIFLTASLLAAAQSRPQPDDEGKILALENAWNLAEAHKDIKALNRLLADSLVYVEYDGTLMNKAQFLESIKDPSYHPEQIVNEKMLVQVYGGTAVVTATYLEKGVEKGRPYRRRGRFTDTWMYRDGLWQCVASHATPLNK
jgi:ketosteroid isomerase-like protein